MNLGWNRRNLGRLVLLAWAGALAWLARRELSPSDARSAAERATRVAPGAHFYALYAGDRQVGQLNISLDTVFAGTRLSELWVADLPLADSTHQIASSAEFLLSRSLQLHSYIRKVFGLGLPDQLDVTVGDDSVFGYRSSEGDRIIANGQVRADVRATLPAMLPLRAAVGGHLRTGAVFRLPVLDPESGRTRSVEIRVTAESSLVVSDSAVWDSVGGRWAAATQERVRAWRLEHDAWGVATVDWVDRGGVLIQEEIAGGIRLERGAFEVVRNNYNAARRKESSAWRRAVPGMMALLSQRIPPDAGPPSRRFLLPSDSNAPWTGPGLARGLAGGRQSIRGDTLIVLRATPPDTGTGGPAPTVERWNDWRPIEASVQRAADAALAGLPDGAAAEAKLRRLTDWVAHRIVTDTLSSAPGMAITTLLRRRGGADGKTALLVAMARAAGLPARPVAGVAVLATGTYAHAWAEVWTGAWTAADPCFGQVPASASLIRLQIGKRSRLMDLLPVAGSARFLPLPSRR